MANRFWYQKVRSLLVGRADVSGSFRPNGSSGVVSGGTYGRGFSVARTSVGLYTITLADQYAKLIAAKATVQGTDGHGYHCEWGAYNATSRTITLRVIDSRSAGFVPLNLFALRDISGNAIQNLAAVGGTLASDSTPILERVNGATDKAARVKWAASDVSEVQFPPIPLAPQFASATDIVVNLRAKMSGATNTPTITVGAFVGICDTDAGGATAALSSTIATVTRTIAAADVGAAPGPLNLTLTPGAHGTDAVELYAAWLTYARLVDLASNADNRIHFELTFSVSSVD